MAFLKFAKGQLKKPGILFAEWDALRSKALSPAPDFQKRTARVILQEYDPSKYMLSHATIVASVDVDRSPAPIGRHFVEGFEINRRSPEYYITPASAQYVNNNNDSFERKLLLATFKSFIGAYSYVEHVQIPELAKGRIVDAAARDVGDSIYVDILIANDLKHAPLIRAIKSGELGTLSMGCFTPGSQVTMVDGRRLPIEEVSVGDLVLTHKGRAREVTNKQIKIGRFSMKRIEVVGIPTAITTTRNHPFFVLRAPKICACGCGESLTYNAGEALDRRVGKRFKRGHQLRIINPMRVYSLAEAKARRAQIAEAKLAPNLEEVRADELQPGDLVCFPKVGSEIVNREDATEGKARLLGYFLAEGSFLKCKGVRTEVQFNFSMSEKDSFVSETVQLLRQEFPSSNPWVQCREDRNTCTVHVSGKAISEWFYRHGGEYSHLKKLSVQAVLWPKEIQRHIVGSWLNGDGTTASSLFGLSGTTTSYDLACQMHMLMNRCGVHARLYCKFEGKSVDVKQAVNGGVALRGAVDGRLASFTLAVGQRGSVALAETTSKLVCEPLSNAPWRESDTHLFFPIRSIENVSYEGPVHDMEVEEDHSYVVDGVAVHNCSTSDTTCSRCGNVAEDETQLCACIRFYKGQEFIDELGGKRKVAELCGHYADPNSVRFIEASWVANPAFKGAVLRSILTPEERATVGQKLHLAFASPAPEANLSMLKAARSMSAQEQETPTTDQLQTTPPTPKSPIEKAVEDLSTAIREQAIEHVRKEINQGEAAKVKEVIDLSHGNESLIRTAMQHSEWRKLAKVVISFVGKAQARKVLEGLILYKQGKWEALRTAGMTGREILAVSRVLDLLMKKSSMAGETRVYRTVLSVGGTGPYDGDAETYLAACRQVLGRVVTGNEAAKLLEKGRLYALGRS